MRGPMTKVCKKCQKQKPESEFYVARPGTLSSRCRDCHGLADRTCRICGSRFEGRSAQVLCSDPCRKKDRPQTFRDCENCGSRFGPVPRLSRRFCTYACKASAMRTGRRYRWVSTPEATAAHLQVRYAIRRGEISRPKKCEKCGTRCKPDAAHSDYGRPLDVRWLCKRCHVKWDRSSPKGGATREEIRCES